MPKFRNPALVSILPTVLACACEPDRPVVVDQPDGKDGPESWKVPSLTSIDRFDEQALRERSLVPHRQVAWLGSGNACEDVPLPGRSWTMELLARARGDQDSNWCLFVGDPDSPDLEADIRKLSGEVQGQGGGIGPDQLVVGPLGTLEDALADEFKAQLRSEIGTLGYVGGYPGGPPQVRLVILDTAANNPNAGQPTIPAIRHGDLLARIAREVLCPVTEPGPTPPCPVDIQTRLALPMTGQSFNTERLERAGRDVLVVGLAPSSNGGGQFGTLSQLAQGIEQAVDGWVLDRDQGGPRSLVLNFSIGWPAYLAGKQDMAWSPAVGSVYRALRRAQCEGALNVAAAGNRSGGPDGGSGLMMPASWKAVSPGAAQEAIQQFGEGAPSLDCPALTGQQGSFGDIGPLLYVAGGVSVGNRPIGNGRPAGEPDVVIYADHASVDDPAAGRPTRPMTGTSVAALLVSTAAAAAWANTAQPASSLATSLTNAGTAFSPEGWSIPGPIQRLDLCAGLQGAGPYTCTAPDHAVASFEPELAAWRTSAVYKTPTLALVTGTSCAGQVWAVAGVSGACPLQHGISLHDAIDQLSSVQDPLATTQPPPVRCPPCSEVPVAMGDILEIALQEKQLVGDSNTVVVDYKTSTGIETVHYALNGVATPMEIESPGVIVRLQKPNPAWKALTIRLETKEGMIAQGHPLFIVSH